MLGSVAGYLYWADLTIVIELSEHEIRGGIAAEATGEVHVAAGVKFCSSLTRFL
jgi:hypothetical protein